MRRVGQYFAHGELSVFSGFCLVAFWTPENRFKHFHYVALFLWFLSATNFIYGLSVFDWLLGWLSIYGLMLVAEGTLRIFKKDGYVPKR